MGLGTGNGTLLAPAARSHLLHGKQPRRGIDEETARIGELDVALSVAAEGSGLAGIEEALEASDSDYLFFPEAFVTDDQLAAVQEAVAEAGKWLLTGVSEDSDPENRYLGAVVIAPDGQIKGRHRKTAPTTWEREAGYRAADEILALEMGPLKVGVALCYEIHFPEVARLYALQGAKLIFNPIGTGMWNDAQYEEWTTIARARAIENRVFVIGCSHDNDELPIAFAYGPNGEVINESRREGGVSPVTLDFSEFPINTKLADRRPELYGPLSG